MKEIKLGQILIKHRHMRGITQDELAKYMGVTTAAISKWETEATYPDIMMLPKLATYFDISIDELMGYEPQLDKVEIQKWYHRLSKEFTDLPFDEALEHCREMAKKYYSCYPFIFQIGSLLVNNSMLAENTEKFEHVIWYALELFRRVKENSSDPAHAKTALQMEAYCLLILKHPSDVLEILDHESPVMFQSEPLLASAYQITGNTLEAKKVLQIVIYQGLLAQINLLTSYMGLCTDNFNAFNESCIRLQIIADAFNLSKLHPGILLSGYITMAQGWAELGETEKALDALEQYTDLASGEIFPMRLHGDSYFTFLDNWLDDTLNLGQYPPRDESLIRRSITQSLSDNPAFANFADSPRFQSMIKRLQDHGEVK